MYTIVLFDLDGTLTDPKIGITTCVQYALQKMGIEEPDLDKLIPFIGPPLTYSFKEFYHMTDEQAEQAIEYYRERFSTTGLYENAVFSGIPEMLEELRQQGKTLIVATSKPTIYSVKILEYFKLDSYFQSVVGSNLDGTRVEKHEVIEYVLTELGDYDRSQIIMVGDRMHDIRGAKHNGLDVVGVAYGYGSREELEQAEPNHIVDTVAELREYLVKG
ncbi:HAD family hydrolase [Anaerospora sp.]|jgi:phosphoglycolate phosphatase|uniref:HAD family hydrolase n=1 Tax=Anaerospora sp. TaxID=1960278 RepID=UPI0028A078A9|nr:HAD family hydrolase [Anaerospora sp.]